MRRLLVLLAVGVGCAGFGVLGLGACGGNDKPPLTPDTVEPTLDTPEAGAPATPPATPSKK